MKTVLLMCATLASLLAVPSAVRGQAAVDAEKVLEQAAHVTMVEGDLARAAALYRQVATSASANRYHVARALVALADTYDIQGSPDAVSLYKRVVSEFSDQSESFLVASAKLNAISARAFSGRAGKSSGVAYQLILQDAPQSQLLVPRTYDFSPDGAKLVMTARATDERKRRFPRLLTELYVRGNEGPLLPLIEDAEDWEWMGHPRWSPNGRYVLYSQGKTGVGRRLMLLDLRTQTTKQLMGEHFQASNGAEWMPDSAGLVLRSSDGFRIVGLNGKLKKHLAAKLGHLAQMNSVSPNGRYLLYHKITTGKEDSDEMDVWQLDLKSGTHVEVTSEPGYEGWPVWSRDGKHIYYVSGPKAARNVFRIKAGSRDAPRQITAYSNASVMYPTILSGGQLTFTLAKDNHVVLMAGAKTMDASRPVVRGLKPMLSPDGQSVYYFDDQPGRVGLWKIAATGGDPTQLVSGAVLTSYGPKTLLSPDGLKIAYAQHRGETTSLFVMPSSGGDSTELFSTDGVRHLIPVWSPNGKELAFAVDGDMLVIPSSGGEASVLASRPRWESWSLEWSPDGKSIAAFAYLDDEEENNVILVVDRATKQVARVTPQSESSYKEILAWHPDGDRISYMYYNPEDGNGSRLVSLENAQISDIADLPDPQWDYIGLWGPDKRYYFSSSVRGIGDGWGLYAFDPDSGEYETLRHYPVKSVSLPTWSADGRRMAWFETEPIRQIWLMDNYE